MKIGISWKGSARHVDDTARSTRLEQWAPVFATGHQFVSLQPDATSAEAKLLARHGIEAPVRPSWDWLATARLLLSLDLVVAVDTGVVHLAGAMGRPAWVLIAYVPDWRWMLDRDTTPWYGSVRLFRQPRAGDWDAVLARVAGELGQAASLAA